MMVELEALVAWWPPESLRKDCNTWVSRCRLCQAASQQARREPMLKAVRSYKRLYRLQMDLMHVKPVGQNGERYIYTVIDVASRYPFLRAS